MDPLPRPPPGRRGPDRHHLCGYENPPGVSTENRVEDFLESPRAGWYNNVNLTAHDHGGHFVPWEIPGGWVDDLRRTFRGRRPSDSQPADGQPAVGPGEGTPS